MRDHVDSKPVSDAQRKQINYALLLFMVLVGVSFRAVESASFLYFCDQLRPNYTPPGIVLLNCPTDKLM